MENAFVQISERQYGQVRAAAVTALKAVAEVGHSRALQGCLDRMQSQEPFVRAASLEAFCAICPSADARITEVPRILLEL